MPIEPVAVLPGPRVTNPRPISTEPPDPRDTTREIEKSARQRDVPDSRAPVERKAPDKAIEARTLVGGSSGAPVRPITPAPEASHRAPLPALASAPIVLARVEPVAPSTPAATREPAGADRDIIEGRLSATRDWLAAAPQTTHTIQIMGSNNEQQLKNQLKSLSTVLDPNRIFVFRTVAQGKPATTVVYGAYADRESALRALAKLPTSISANRPVLRTVNGIRTEMKQHGKL